MSYTLEQFSSELISEVNKEYDVEKLSKWAMSKYHEEIPFEGENVRIAILKISAMSAGPEFELTKYEIIDFARRLIAN